MTSRFRFYSEVLLRVLPEEDYALRLEALAEALPLAVAATDASGRVLVWNPALSAWMGPRELAVGRPLLEALPALARDPNLDWRVALRGALLEGARLDLVRHPLGERVVRATLAPMRGPGGQVLGAVLALQDITSGAREEERRLLQARSEAVAALGAGIAHEIRNPINALSLNLQLLRERIEDLPRAAIAAKADAMIAELQRMESLVAHLLEVSRGGPPDLAPERVDDIVAAVVERLEGMARHAGAQLAFRPGSQRLLEVDRARIDRAVHNVVRNALEAAGPGGRVEVVTRDDPHSTVIVVDDNGPGIDPADRKRVFEIFFPRKRGGTGLGLPLARRAIESHGGEIEVLERPGGGARFVIHLPLAPWASGVPGAPGTQAGPAAGRA
ncbi:MAG: two-component system sensor histidine kinase NtrB [Planctomycetia bacterium]